MHVGDPDWTLRYSRHLALPDFGAAGQGRLGRAGVMLVGMGGLGTPAAMYLATSGIGRLLLNDFDRVDTSNLPRQVLYRDTDLGEAKVAAAAAALRGLNPACEIETIDGRLDETQLQQTAASVDLVVDGSDNFGTRFAINSACVRVRRPLISGAAVRYEGQLTAFDSRDTASPCYACLYPERGEELESCRENGVLAPLTGVIGSLMAVEAIKMLTGIGTSLVGRLLRVDARSGEIRFTKLNRDPACPVCVQR